MNGLPEDIGINPEIFVDYNIADIAYISPRNFRIWPLPLQEYAGLSDHGQAVKHRLHRAGIGTNLS